MSEEELLRKEIADLHAEIIALRRTIEKLQVEANFELLVFSSFVFSFVHVKKKGLTW